MIDKQKQGKKNRTSGRDFELRVRHDLEKSGWNICKWMNNVSEPFEQDIGEWVRKMEPAKRRYNPFMKALSIGNGFPDFIAFQLPENYQNFGIEQEGMIKGQFNLCLVIGVEVKSNGYLTKEEKEKCSWYLNKKIFSRILIASKGKKRGEIVYKEFEEVQNG